MLEKKLEGECGKNKVIVVGREGVPARVDVKMNDEIKKFVSSLTSFGSCSNKYGRPPEDVEIKVGEELKLFDAMETLLNARSIGLGVK